jgi:AraC family transcriptional regulator
MTPESVNSSNTRIYTDAPVALSLGENGLVHLARPCNVMLNRSARFLEMPSIGEATVLSVRWARNGQRLFESGSRRFAVDDSSYRIFNIGSEFKSTINSPIPVDCYTVCFQPESAASALASITLPEHRLLDDPEAAPGTTTALHFMEKTSSHDRLVSPVLRQLVELRDAPIATHSWFEEQFQTLLLALLRAEAQVPDDMSRIAAARPATREELYRRIHGARDYMEAGLFRPLTISEIACESAFSPFHFLRIFKQFFLVKRRINT